MTIGRASVIKGIPLVALIACALMAGCGRPPQLGNNDRVWGTADALWTAVGARRADLLAKVSADIDKLHAAGDLNDETHVALHQVVETANGGDWTTARTNLRSFIEGQRRNR